MIIILIIIIVHIYIYIHVVRRTYRQTYICTYIYIYICIHNMDVYKTDILHMIWILIMIYLHSHGILEVPGIHDAGRRF